MIRGIFNPDYRLTQYNLITNEVEAIELLTKKGRDLIKEYYRNNEHILETDHNGPLTCLLNEPEKIEESTTKSMSSTTVSRRKTDSRGSNKNNSYGVKIDKCNLFNSYQIAYEKYQDFEDNNNFPDEIYTVAYHRRFVKKMYYFFSPH
jgi:hypothetical protein